jgi:N-methylhydantoinase A/oxoprolinase/acetone carboxylase beta subunit
MASPRGRVGIDIGGTFTDLVLVDDATGAVSVSKVLTTPPSPAVAVADGFAMATLTAGVAAEAIRRVVHGTTLVTNAVVERKGARTGLVTTAGFRDTLEVEGFRDASVGVETLAHLLAQAARDQRARLLQPEVVHVVAVLGGDLEDVSDGLVTPEGAREAYAVAVRRVDGGWAIDAAGTARLRGPVPRGG